MTRLEHSYGNASGNLGCGWRRDASYLRPAGRIAGRIEGELWQAFLAECQREGLTHTDGLRRLIRGALGMPEPVPLGDTGSGSGRLTAS